MIVSRSTGILSRIKSLAHANMLMSITAYWPASVTSGPRCVWAGQPSMCDRSGSLQPGGAASHPPGDGRRSGWRDRGGGECGGKHQTEGKKWYSGYLYFLLYNSAKKNKFVYWKLELTLETPSANTKQTSPYWWKPSIRSFSSVYVACLLYKSLRKICCYRNDNLLNERININLSSGVLQLITVHSFLDGFCL